MIAKALFVRQGPPFVKVGKLTAAAAAAASAAVEDFESHPKLQTSGGVSAGL